MDPDNGDSPAGIELDTSTHDDPASALEEALDRLDRDKAVGAFRLMEAAGRQPVLPQPLGIRLAGYLEQAGMFLESARMYRLAAEADLETDAAPDAIFKSACLLLGPAHRPEPGADMLLYLAANYPDHPKVPTAERMHAEWLNGQRGALIRSLQSEGIEPPRDGSAIGRARLVASARIEEELKPRGRFAAWQNGLAGRFSPSTLRTLDRLLGIAFVVLAGAYLLAVLQRDRFPDPGDIDPALRQPPDQTPLENPEPIRFRRGDYHLTLMPLFRYRIAGLIVSVNDYAMLGLRYQDFFELDLCMIWGGAVRTGAYRAPGVSFVHHGNVCYAQWTQGAGIRGSELSNTHIYATDEELLDELEALRVGDQVRLEGYLVEVAAVPVRAGAGRIPSISRVRSSTTRTDQGMGACEILFAEKLEVLATANRAWRLVGDISFWFLAFVILASILRLLLFPVGLSGRSRTG